VPRDRRDSSGKSPLERYFFPGPRNWIKVGVVDISLFEKNILHYWNNHASRIG
jgi:hypothetical protein